ncbi:MAG TPA: serine/threonine-protein kinase [Kofleriaceae bacterium]
MAEQAAAADWTCATCGASYPPDFAVCPRDATPRAEAIAKTGDPLIGEVLGRTYRVTGVVGEGGMARLYKAEHLRIGTHVAVKVIHDDLAANRDLLARFEREARAAARIDSEHVVRLVDVLRTADGRPCLVEELLQGEDLQAMLNRAGKLKVAQAIPIAREICRAVADAHAAGVVHRDLKPSNVFLCQRDGEPHVKVFDFGVAKLEDDEQLTRTDAVMGTAAYMAPEQARRAADAGPLADVYAIGAIVYHMLAGEPPYGNVPALSRFALVLHEEPARPSSLEPSISAEAEAVIQHAMARDPAHRVASALDLEAQLAALDKPAAPQRMTRAQSSPSIPTPDAAAIARRARMARPVACAVTALSSLATGAWLAGLFAAWFGTSALLTVVALAAVAGVAALHVRGLRPRWNSSPAVLAYLRPSLRGLAAGTIALGACELASIGAATALRIDLIGAGWCLAFAGVVAALGLAWERFRLGDRMRDRVG